MAQPKKISPATRTWRIERPKLPTIQTRNEAKIITFIPFLNVAYELLNQGFSHSGQDVFQGA